MNLEQIIENLKLEIAELNNKISNLVDVKCNHTMCDLCLNILNNQNEDKKNLQIILAEKEVLLSNLISLK